MGAGSEDVRASAGEPASSEAQQQEKEKEQKQGKMIGGSQARGDDDEAGFTMSSAGLECSCRPVLCGGCKCDVTIPHRLLNCCFPCLILLTKLTVRPLSSAALPAISNRSEPAAQVLAREQALDAEIELCDAELERLRCARDAELEVLYEHRRRQAAQLLRLKAAKERRLERERRAARELFPAERLGPSS